MKSEMTLEFNSFGNCFGKKCKPKKPDTSMAAANRNEEIRFGFNKRNRAHHDQYDLRSDNTHIKEGMLEEPNSLTIPMKQPAP